MRRLVIFLVVLGLTVAILASLVVVLPFMVTTISPDKSIRLVTYSYTLNVTENMQPYGLAISGVFFSPRICINGKESSDHLIALNPGDKLEVKHFLMSCN